MVLGQEALPDKSNELTAIPALLARLAENGGLRGALVSIDAISADGTVATAIKDVGAGYLLAIKANQPSLRTEKSDHVPRGGVRTYGIITLPGGFG